MPTNANICQQMPTYANNELGTIWDHFGTILRYIKTKNYFGQDLTHFQLVHIQETQSAATKL